VPAPTIYRSTDTNAPVLFGGAASLTTLLDAILVNGYGSAFATGTVSGDGTNPADGDTVTVGSITYTFRASVASGAANGVLIGANSASTMLALSLAINGNGTPGTTYTAGTQACPEAWTSYPNSGQIIPLNARKGGSAGNSIALARTAAGTPHVVLSGATLTGGAGTDTKAGAGWTKSFSGATGQGVYRQPAGSRFYLQVDDTGPGAGGQREARCTGWEAATAWNTGSGQFPTVALAASGSVCRKSSTLDGNTTRPWVAFVDDRTLYLFTLSGDTAGNYHGFSFGDFYSLIGGDVYKCLIMGGSTESASAVQTSQFGQIVNVQVGTSQPGHWLPRNYSGFGGPLGFVKTGDYGLVTAASSLMAGTVGFPNTDGWAYLAPLRIADGSSPGQAALNGTPYLRGRLRGLYHICHPISAFADGDVIAGSGAYAGRTFQVVRFIHSSSVSAAFGAVETTAWETST
jgi:hypothetical protein